MAGLARLALLAAGRNRLARVGRERSLFAPRVFQACDAVEHHFALYTMFFAISHKVAVALKLKLLIWLGVCQRGLYLSGDYLQTLRVEQC